jgi:hypothetical protein
MSLHVVMMVVMWLRIHFKAGTLHALRLIKGVERIWWVEVDGWRLLAM